MKTHFENIQATLSKRFDTFKYSLIPKPSKYIEKNSLT